MPKDYQSQIENNFKWHAPTQEQVHIYEEVRDKAKELALFYVSQCPDSLELSLALTHLEEAVMWANAAIARNPVGDGPA